MKVLQILFPCAMGGVERIASQLLESNEKIDCYIGIDSKYYEAFVSYVHPDVDIFRREWFDNILRVDFENIKVNIPSEYHKILSHRYGDYMKYPPISEQNGHHDFLAYLREEYS